MATGESRQSLLLPLVICTGGMLIDLFGSMLIVHTLGVGAEGNPLMASLISQPHGWEVVIVLKLVWLGLVWVGSLALRRWGAVIAWVAALPQAYLAFQVIVGIGIIAF